LTVSREYDSVSHRNGTEVYQCPRHFLDRPIIPE
jgi:hypothetical protein